MINRGYKGCSGAQSGLGLVVCGLGIAAILIESRFSDKAVPLWSGAWFIMTGLLGLSAAHNQINTCLVGGHLVFCIIGIVYALNLSVLFATASAEEQQTSDQVSPIEARIAVDVMLALTGIFQLVLSVRCSLYASKVCCGGESMRRHGSSSRTVPSRIVEVESRTCDNDVPQTPSAIAPPPSYAYVNSSAPQSLVRFANGDFPPPPAYADQPPSYSEVTAGMVAWTPSTMQIQISYTATAEGQAAVANEADSQATETEMVQLPQTETVQLPQTTQLPQTEIAQLPQTESAQLPQTAQLPQAERAQLPQTAQLPQVEIAQLQHTAQLPQTPQLPQTEIAHLPQTETVQMLPTEMFVEDVPSDQSDKDSENLE
ncbi:uncharacterized protein [Asterias amurensis]|uniref:uncharacterized protein n=1 Tax=Asterias amurensis TaxID=7602 RepID=UPI003AB82F45